MKPIALNFIGGPGTGKSTMAAGTFAKLKRAGVNCELVQEYAKDKVWEGSVGVLENQVYVLGKQHHRMHRLRGKVDVIVSDSPLALSAVYGESWGGLFGSLVLELFGQYTNMTYVLVPRDDYDPRGRLQTQDEAVAISETVLTFLKRNGVPFTLIESGPESEDQIAEAVVERLSSN